MISFGEPWGRPTSSSGRISVDIIMMMTIRFIINSIKKNPTKYPYLIEYATPTDYIYTYIFYVVIND